MPGIEIFTRNIVTSELNEEMEPIFQRQYVESKPNHLVHLQIDTLIPLMHTGKTKRQLVAGMNKSIWSEAQDTAASRGLFLYDLEIQVHCKKENPENFIIAYGNSFQCILLKPMSSHIQPMLYIKPEVSLLTSLCGKERTLHLSFLLYHITALLCSRDEITGDSRTESQKINRLHQILLPTPPPPHCFHEWHLSGSRPGLGISVYPVFLQGTPSTSLHPGLDTQIYWLYDQRNPNKADTAVTPCPSLPAGVGKLCFTQAMRDRKMEVAQQNSRGGFLPHLWAHLSCRPSNTARLNLWACTDISWTFGWELQ